MSARLAASYRSWVRWYPADWRSANADAMLGVYLDVAEEQGRNRLTAAEKRGILANGLEARLNRLLPAAVRDGVATGAVALLGSLGAIVLFFFEWAPFWSNGPVWSGALRCTAGDFANYCSPGELWGFGPFASVVGAVSAVAILTAGLAFLGRPVLTRVMLALTAVCGIAAGVAIELLPFFGDARPPLEAPLFFALVALAGLIGRTAAPRRLGFAFLAWFAIWLVVVETGGAWLGWIGWREGLDGGTGAGGFFLVALGRQTVSWMVAVAVVAALVLIVARRSTLALVILASAVLWLPLWIRGVWADSYQGYELRLPELIVAAGSLVIVAFSAGRRTARHPAL